MLNTNEISQFFIDTAYKCLPYDIEDAKSLLVLIGYNFKKDLFELILVAILSNEDSDIFRSFYFFLKNVYCWEPKYLIFDFGSANLKAVKEVFADKDFY